MKIVYKPSDHVGVRKAIARSVGMCPIDLDVDEILRRTHYDVTLPGGDECCPLPLHLIYAPYTVEITFVGADGIIDYTQDYDRVR